MSRKCHVSKKRFNKANKVSFSNKHHRHKQEPNLQWKRVWVPEEGRFIRVRVSTKVLKTISKYGYRAALKRYQVKESAAQS